MKLAACLGALFTTASLLVAPIAMAYSGDQYDRTIRVFNQTSSPIVEVNAANRDSRDWEGNLLFRNERIMPGQTLDIDTDDGTGYCIYDLRAFLQNGQEVDNWGVNVCVSKNWTVTPPSGNTRRNQ